MCRFQLRSTGLGSRCIAILVEAVVLRGSCTCKNMAPRSRRPTTRIGHASGRITGFPMLLGHATPPSSTVTWSRGMCRSARSCGCSRSDRMRSAWRCRVCRRIPPGWAATSPRGSDSVWLSSRTRATSNRSTTEGCVRLNRASGPVHDPNGGVLTQRSSPDRREPYDALTRRCSRWGVVRMVLSSER